MGDIKVLTSDRTVFPQDRRQFVSQRSYEGFTRARMTVVKRAVVKVNTDPDPNGNETISVPPISPPINGVSEESSVTAGVVGEEDSAEDISEPSNAPINGKSEEASDMLEKFVEEEITPSTADDLSLSPAALVHKGIDEVDGRITHIAENLSLKALDFVGKFTHRLEGAAKKISKKQVSIALFMLFHAFFHYMLDEMSVE